MGTRSIRGIDPDSKRSEQTVTSSPVVDAALVYPELLLARAHALATAEAKRAYLDVPKAVRAMSETYTEARESLASLRGAAERYVGTLAFFFARDLPKAISVFAELDARGLLPRTETMRVLDLGAGLGTTSLGLARFAHVAGAANALTIDAVELDAGALDRMQGLARDASELVPTTITTHATSIDAFLANARGPWDVVLFGLSLNELAPDPKAREALLARVAGVLAPRGVVVVIEPALHEITRDLMALRDRLVVRDDVVVLGPCTHANPCPMLAAGPRDWCHAELALELPAAPALVASRAGLRDEKPTFAWLALGRARDAAVDADSELVRIVSRPLGSKGKTELVACRRAGLTRLRAIDRDGVTPALGTFRRGQLARLRLHAEGEALRLGRDAELEHVAHVGREHS